MNVPLYGDEYRKLFGNMATLHPSAQDSPNMTVKISAGGFWSWLNGVAAYVEYLGGYSPVISSSLGGGNAKWTVVCLNSSGAVVNIDGAASATPVLPVIPASRYPIALVYVNNGDTVLTNEYIFDARPIFSNPVRSHADLSGTTTAGCHTTAAITGLDATIADLATSTALTDGLADKADVAGSASPTFKLNQDHTGTPSSDAAIEVERGAAANVSILWDEGGASGEWKYTNDGSTWYSLATAYYNDGSQNLVLKETVVTTTPPTLTTGQAQIWVNAADSKTYLIYKPAGLTQVKVLMT